MKYPSSIKIIKIPCTGKVDVIHLLRSFEKGADGVYVLGCLEGACQFNNGNIRARKRVALVQEILDSVGIGGERVQMYNLSASEAPLFVQIAKEMTDRIIEMGPNPIKLKKKAA